MTEQQQPGVWGIDIGQCALKAVRLQAVDGQVLATAFDYVEHPKILSQPDADPDQLTREALEKFLSRNTLKGDQIAISVPGQSGLARFVKLPPVEEKKIPDIVRFEAKQQIPFPLDEVVWDYQKVGAGAVTDGFAMETEIGLFALKRDMVGRYLDHFRSVDVEVHIVQMSPLALCNFVAFDLLKVDPEPEGPGEDGEPKAGARPCVVALDIGTDNSNLVVTDGERVIWQRPIPFGGNHFTRALTKDLKMTFAKAEHLKRNATKSPDLKKILAALKPVLNDFVGEVQRSLGYFTNTHRNAKIEYMVGLGNAFRLPGLQKFLSEKLQLDVRRLQNFERLGGEGVTGAALFSQNVMSFATAYGLALQGLDRTRLRTNLLPPEIRFERMIRAKKPWAVAAAAALLFGVLATTVNYAMAYRAVAADSVQQAMKEGDEIASRFSAEKAAFDKKDKEVKAVEAGVRNVLVGSEDRANWLMLSKYVNDCLPVPGAMAEGKVKSADRKALVITDGDGKERTFNPDEVLVLVQGKPAGPNDVKKDAEVGVVYPDQLTDRSKPYWTPAARLAFVKYWERQALGRNPSPKPEDEGISDLMQINVETVQPGYSKDLKTYVENIKKANPKAAALEGMPEKDQKEPLSGPGWVVELRGYTYHKEGKTFVIDTLVDAIGTRARAATGGKPAELAAGDKDKLAQWERVITNKISHPVLYSSKTTHGVLTGPVTLASEVDRIAVPPQGAPPRLTTESQTASAASPGSSGGGPREADIEGPITRGAGGRGGRRGGGGGGAPAAAPPPPPLGASTRRPKTGGAARVDFIVYFVWKEPV